MKTVFLLMAQYNAAAIIPADVVCRDYFPHLDLAVFVRKCAAGKIGLPLVRIDPRSQKAARGIALSDLANYIDTRAEAARKEMAQLSGAT